MLTCSFRRISISISESDRPLDDDLIPLDVFPDMTLADVKALVHGDTNIPPDAQHIFHNNELIVDANQTLERLQVREGDMLLMAVRDPSTLGHGRAAEQDQGRGIQRQRQGPDPESLRLQIIGDPRIRAQIRQTAPEIADAADDRTRFHDLFNQHQRRLAAAQAEKEAHLAVLNSDPFNVEAQKEIEEMIRLERVQENVQEALENNPESFGRVTMLYIPVIVNGVPVKAFVDSGAQTTIMSPACAAKTNIMRLIDRRFGGIARGVGTAEILGRVHSAEIQIGSYSLPSSFTVMEGKDVDLLLGLDMLKRHQMDISLKDDCLKIQDERVPFLPEAEIPKGFEEALDNEPKIEGPAGTRIGATSGVVEKPSGSTPSSTSANRPAEQSSAPSSSSAPRINIRPLGSQQPQSSSASSSASRPQPPNQRLPPGVTTEAISKVTELGFTREEAIHALAQVNGNVELAIGILL